MSPIGRRPIDAASVYIRRGWPVFPCHQPVPGACGCSCGHLSCSSPGKHPRVSGGLNAATVDGVQITAWWSRWPRANIGLRTGAASGLVVIDVDPDHGGNDTMERLLAAHGALPPGRSVRTGSGGRHLYFRHPGGLVRNDAGRRLGPGVDIRGDGGYVIAPPSRHRSGRQYVVASHGGNIPELPEWLLEALQPPAPARRPSVEPVIEVRAAAWARAALDGELDRLDHAVEGTRNETLNRVAYRLGQIISAGRLQAGDVEPLLIQHGVATGLPEHEVLATIRSGLRAAGRSAAPTVDPDLGPM